MCSFLNSIGVPPVLGLPRRFGHVRSGNIEFSAGFLRDCCVGRRDAAGGNIVSSFAA